MIVTDTTLSLPEADYKAPFLSVDEAVPYPRSYYGFITGSFVRQVPKLMKSNFLQIKNREVIRHHCC